jgi:hypothetical protein
MKPNCGKKYITCDEKHFYKLCLKCKFCNVRVNGDTIICKNCYKHFPKPLYKNINNIILSYLY